MVKTMMQKHFLQPGFAFLPALGFVGRRPQSPLLHKRERTNEQVGHTLSHGNESPHTSKHTLQNQPVASDRLCYGNRYKLSHNAPVMQSLSGDDDGWR